MKQKPSSQTSSIDIDVDEDFDTSDLPICHIADLWCPYELCTEYWNYLVLCITNHMKKRHHCILCQQLISSIINHVDLYLAGMICEMCGAIKFDCCNCEEFSTETNLSTMHIRIRHSVPHKTNTDKKVNILKNETETTKGDVQNYDKSALLSNSSQQSKQEYLSLQATFQQQNTLINALQSNQYVLEQNLKEIQQKMEDYHYATYDGSFIWKFTNVQEKFSEAHSGLQRSFDSPIFYSSPTGYKMRARLYPYGDGDAQNTHMSIKLVILKGNYDNILEWPFPGKVIFGLFDQTGQGLHIIDSFRPDRNSESFQQPRSEMNVPSGILKFYPLALLEQEGNLYTRNDNIFIKIMIDFGEIPTPLLPYIMSINPGLPTHVQEAKRQAECNKYKRLRMLMIAQIERDWQEIGRSILIPVHPESVTSTNQQLSSTNSPSMPCEDLSDN